MFIHIWSLPLLFLIHEFEEYTGFEKWIQRRGQDLMARFPTTRWLFDGYSQKGMRFAIAEQLSIIVLVCFLATMNDQIEWWFGVYVAFLVHLIVHIVVAGVIRVYVPTLLTSILLSPICIAILYHFTKVGNLDYRLTVFYSATALILAMLNLRFVHFIMKLIK